MTTVRAGWIGWNDGAGSCIDWLCRTRERGEGGRATAKRDSREGRQTGEERKEKRVGNWRDFNKSKKTKN